MNISRNLIQGAAGGLLGGAFLGLIEAIYLLATQGAPDYVAPFYGLVLYGLIALPLGIGGGVVFSIIEKMGFWKRKDDAFAFAFGVVAGAAPMLLAVLMYLGNKVVYAEQGVPMTGKLAILGIVGAFALIELTVGAGMVRHPFSFLLKGPGVLGTFGGLAILTGGVAMVPAGDDPRATWNSGKGIPAGMDERPDVLLIAVDTLRADYLGTYGREGDPSPTLDAIAADGVVFEQHIAGASWTRSSFASLWSSRIPSSHNADTKAARLPDEVEILPEVLTGAGITAANLANNINVTSTFNFDQGWDTFIYESPAYPFGATESVFSLSFYKVFAKALEKLGRSKDVETFYQPAEVVLADAQAFMKANSGNRWMLGVHLMEPHDPYFEHPYLAGSGQAEFNGVGFARAEVESPAPSQADYLKGVYAQEILHMDKKLAGFIQWLKTEGLYDDLMIVITADHGEEFAEHGGFWHGTTLYDEQIHIPLIVKLPGNALAGTRVPWQSRAIDVSPTIAAAFGVAPSPQWEGNDLLADVRQMVEDQQARERAVADARQQLTALEVALAAIPDDAAALEALAEVQRVIESADTVDPCAAYGRALERVAISEEDFEGNVVSSIRKEGFKLIHAQEGNPRGLPTEALFDIVADPGELSNVAGRDGSTCGRFVSDLPRAMGKQMGDTIVEAASRATSGGDAAMSDAEKQKLCALGYLSGSDCE